MITMKQKLFFNCLILLVSLILIQCSNSTNEIYEQAILNAAPEFYKAIKLQEEAVLLADEAMSVLKDEKTNPEVRTAVSRAKTDISKEKTAKSVRIHKKSQKIIREYFEANLSNGEQKKLIKKAIRILEKNFPGRNKPFPSIYAVVPSNPVICRVLYTELLALTNDQFKELLQRGIEIKKEEILNSIKEGEFKDERDGKVYKTVTILDQTWMAENLQFEGLGNMAKDDKEWDLKLREEESWWRYPDYNKELGQKYGLVYNKTLASEVCPEGWELPYIAQFYELQAMAEIVNNMENPTQVIKTVTGWDKNDKEEDMNGTNLLKFYAQATPYYNEDYVTKERTVNYSAANWWGKRGSNPSGVLISNKNHEFNFEYNSRIRNGIRCIKIETTENSGK
jgi:uncharacterized protein (TIGR02145 family)